MEKFIFKMRVGTQLRLRSADTKEGMLEHVVYFLRECAARGQTVQISKDGECQPASKYEASCAAFQGDTVLLPPSMGGTFTELDEVFEKERAEKRDYR